MVNYFADGVFSDTDAPLLHGVPIIKKVCKLMLELALPVLLVIIVSCMHSIVAVTLVDCQRVALCKAVVYECIQGGIVYEIHCTVY